MKFYNLIFLIFFFLPLYAYSGWKDVECSKISKHASILNSNYKPTYCQKFSDAQVIGYVTDSFDGTVFMSIENQRIIAANTVWGSDYAYQRLKEEQIEEIVEWLDLGKVISISSNSKRLKSSNKITYRYKIFETPTGKGFYGGGTVGKILWTFILYTEEKSMKINEEVLNEIISSLTISGLQKGIPSDLMLYTPLRKKSRT